MKSIIKTLLLAGVGALAIAGSAAAADLSRPVYTKAPPPPPPTWTGCYVGGTVGGVWSRTDVSWAANPAGFGTAADISATGTGPIDTSGATAGGEIGCNYQTGAWVFGGEADIQWTDINGTRNATTLAGFPLSETAKSDWLSTFRGRLGFASGAWLFYATGGLAVGHTTFTDLITFPTTVDSASVTSTQVGWVAGAGAEWMFATHWSAKAEYLHVDLGTVNSTSVNSDPVTFPLSTIANSHKLTEEIGRVGVNFHF